MNIIGEVQQYVALALCVACIGVQVYALIDCVKRPPQAFQMTGNQTKVLWLVITGVGLALGILAFPDPMTLRAIAGTVAAVVYLVRVKPAVSNFGGGGGPRRSSGGW